MALIVFFDESTSYRIPDNILVTFYLSTDTDLSIAIDSEYSSNGAVNAPNLNAGYTYLTTFNGPSAPAGLYYTTLEIGTDSAVVTITPPASGLPPGVIEGPTGATGATGQSGLFTPVGLIFDFVVGNYITSNYQLITLTDITPFVPGTFILLFNKHLQKSGVWQVVKTYGTYTLPDFSIHTLQNNQILIAPIDLSNEPYGFGCNVGDTFTGNNATVVLYGATGVTQAFSNISGINLSSPQQNDILVYKNGGFTNAPYLIYELETFANQIPVNTVIYRHVFTRNVVINGGLGYCGVRPFVASTFNISRNGSQIATLIFNPDGTTSCTLSGTDSFNFANTDVLEITSPESQDITLANIAITLSGFLL